MSVNFYVLKRRKFISFLVIDFEEENSNVFSISIRFIDFISFIKRIEFGLGSIELRF